MKTKSENPYGLHQRYLIKKIVGVGQELDWSDRNGGNGRPKLITKKVDPNAEYFVMRLDVNGKDINHVKACRIGIHAYANAIEATIPQLAKDLRERYPLL